MLFLKSQKNLKFYVMDSMHLEKEKSLHINLSMDIYIKLLKKVDLEELSLYLIMEFVGLISFVKNQSLKKKNNK
jgi:hypothetical protein